MKRPLTKHRLQQGFTLVEIMIVVAILGIVLAIAGPTWVKQRTLSQTRVCQENLTKIEGAKEQWALDNNKDSSATPDWSDLVAADGSGYLKKKTECPSNGTYAIGAIGTPAKCSITAPQDHNP